MNAASLASLLQESTVPDTQRLKAATAELQKNYYSHAESVLLLIEIICTHGDENVRLQAAVQAARLVPKHWSKLANKDQKIVARNHLVQATLKEPSQRVCHADSRVIATIADIEITDGTWPELVHFIYGLINDNDGSVRQKGSYIMYSIIEENPTLFTDKMVEVLGVFARLLQDPVPDVRINTMMSTGAMMLLFEPEEDMEPVKALHALIPSMVEVFKDVVQNGDEEKTSHAFDVFQQFLAYESALLGPFLKDLIQIMIDLAVNKDADDDVRSQALAFLTQTAQYRRIKIQGMTGMGQQLTLKSMAILTEIDDDEDEDDSSPARSALSLLDQLATVLPPRQVIVPLLEVFPSYVQSEDPGHRTAGILALGTVVEGAPDFVTSQLKPLMPHVIRLLNDPDIRVRHAALVGLARLADDLSEELASDHDALISAVAKNLQAAMTATSDEKMAKKNADIIRSACGALDSLAEGLTAEKMRLYAAGLIQQMCGLMNYDDSKVKIAASGALGAIAESLGDEFVPFFPDVVRALGNYLRLKDNEDEFAIRSSVTDSLGRIANAVGAEAFQPYVQDIMHASDEAMRLDHPRLRESSFILWSALSKVYGKQFVTFLPGVFKALFDCLALEDEELALELSEEEKGIIGTNDTIMAAGRKIKVIRAEESNAEDEMDDGDDMLDWDDIAVSPVALEKEVALEVMGDVIANACGAAEIQAYLEKAVESAAPLVEHGFEGCRKGALSTLWRAYSRVWQIYEEETGTCWQPGLPLKQEPSPILVKLGEIVAQATLKVWAEDADRNVITEVNRNLAATLKACGPAILALQNMLAHSVTLLGTIITRSHPCQQDLGDEDDGQDLEGSSEYDWLIIDTALDVVIGLAAALGPQFHEVWKVFEKPLMKFAVSNEDIERSTGVGVIAECIAHMEGEVSPYTEKMLMILLKRLSDTDPETRSNASYATGLLIFHSTATGVYLPKYGTVLQKLEPMLQVAKARMRDNAIGCISRMIMKHPDNVPLGEVLPVVVDLLPLAEDFEENKPLFQCIFQLYTANEPTIQQLTPKLIPVLKSALAPPEEQLEDETRALIFKMVTVMHDAKPDLFASHEDLVNLARMSSS